MPPAIKHLLAPTYTFDRVEVIDLEGWWAAGLRGMILDVDDTLTLKNSALVAPPVQAWLKQARQMGFHCYIVSNNRYPRHIARVAEALEMEGLAQARKPFSPGFLQALEAMQLPPEQVVVIGDRLLTDILGGAWLGMQTCLVAPVTTQPKALKRLLYGFEKSLSRLAGRRPPSSSDSSDSQI
jgi:HAD superfamily phosphatase (TIGR01668 family)